MEKYRISISLLVDEEIEPNIMEIAGERAHVAFDEIGQIYSIKYEDSECIDTNRNRLKEILTLQNKNAALVAENAALRQDNERLKARFSAPIVCICGSTKFKQAWITENARLTGEGNIVLAVGLWGHHERVFPAPEIKENLDNLHKRKIDLCDWVWVLDIGGYIGDSTRSEIIYAELLGKPIHYLSHEYPNYIEPIDPLKADIERKDKELAAAVRPDCDYRQEEENGDTWNCSICGEEWELIDGTPFENNMYYCPKCGSRIITITTRRFDWDASEYVETKITREAAAKALGGGEK